MSDLTFLTELIFLKIISNMINIPALIHDGVVTEISFAKLLLARHYFFMVIFVIVYLLCLLDLLEQLLINFNHCNT